MKTHTLIDIAAHKWLVLGRDPERPTNVADTNQIVIRSDQTTVLLDPGGIEIFPAFLETLTGSVAIDTISSIVLTSVAPDASSSLPLWRQVCTEKLSISAPALWADVITHLDAGCDMKAIGDDGDTINITDSFSLQLIPAHHLHGPAGFSVYDPMAKALYSGSVGSTVNTANASGEFVVDNFSRHIPFLEDYHGRWIASSRARDAWISRVNELAIDYLVPHRGPAFSGDDVSRFIDWFSTASIGTIFPANKSIDQNPSVVEPVAEIVDPVAEPSPEVDDLMAEFETEPTSAPAPASAESTEDVLEDDDMSPDSGLDDAFSELMEEPAPNQTGTPEPGAEYRLVTRSDFDGLVCAVLFEDLDMIDDILFVHPNDMQEGRIDISEKDITTNLPYVPGCHLSFDHHLSEIARVGRKFDNHIIFPDAPSAARVVYDYYGAKDGFPNISVEMMDAVDQGDSAAYEMDDVLNPQKWALLNFIMDSRSGLGRFKGFRIPNYELMMGLIDYCAQYTIEEILELPDVKERVDFFLEQQVKFKDQLERCTTIQGNLAIIDLLNEETVYVGNRFMVYAMFPECNISMHCMWGRDRQTNVYAVGKSIFDKSSKTNVGELMLQYGGGGHHAAGTCQTDPLLAPTVKQALIQKITEDG
jgi:nanoRNase/pAp phosphatase (c-di-AMP/oligoRNAs hydrolase)